MYLSYCFSKQFSPERHVIPPTSQAALKQERVKLLKEIIEEVEMLELEKEWDYRFSDVLSLLKTKLAKASKLEKEGK